MHVPGRIKGNRISLKREDTRLSDAELAAGNACDAETDNKSGQY